MLAGVLAANIETALDRVEQRQQLERQNEQLDEFASVLSHDLRNPLNVAKGRLELAQTEHESEHLDAVEEAHSRMQTLIEDLLSLAREGDTVGKLEAVNMNSFIETCWRNVETKQATIVTEIDRTIQADRSRLKQLLENLFRNAVEHSGTEVTVTVGELDNGIFVEDDGPGIPPEDRDEVFNSGYSTSKKGTGFGLAIVKQIAEAHGWEISVTEGTNGGTRFKITEISFRD
jgi:signal transduction histidine kinase